MQTIKVYRCDFCGYTSQSEVDVKVCENTHIDIKEGYVVDAGYKKGNRVPYKITLRSGDTELVYYNTCYMVKK